MTARSTEPHIQFASSIVSLYLPTLNSTHSPCPSNSQVACVSPAESNLEETLSTLRYASRARAIKNRPIVNRDVEASTIAALRNEIEALKNQLAAAAAAALAAPSSTSLSTLAAPSSTSLSTFPRGSSSALDGLDGAAVRVLLDGTGASSLEAAATALSTLRASAEQSEVLRGALTASEALVGRLKAALATARAEGDALVASRIEAELRAALFEDALLAAGVRLPDEASSSSLSSSESTMDTSSSSQSSSSSSIRRLLGRISELEAQLRTAMNSDEQQGGGNGEGGGGGGNFEASSSSSSYSAHHLNGNFNLSSLGGAGGHASPSLFAVSVRCYITIDGCCVLRYLL